MFTDLELQREKKVWDQRTSGICKKAATLTKMYPHAKVCIIFLNGDEKMIYQSEKNWPTAMQAEVNELRRLDSIAPINSKRLYSCPGDFISVTEAESTQSYSKLISFP
jgi:hypothetical protein